MVPAIFFMESLGNLLVSFSQYIFSDCITCFFDHWPLANDVKAKELSQAGLGGKERRFSLLYIRYKRFKFQIFEPICEDEQRFLGGAF